MKHPQAVVTLLILVALGLGGDAYGQWVRVDTFGSWDITSAATALSMCDSELYAGYGNSRAGNVLRSTNDGSIGTRVQVFLEGLI